MAPTHATPDHATTAGPRTPAVSTSETFHADPFGALLRAWRERRRVSQLALALEVGVSQRHLSFIESGRSTPSRAMVLRLAEHLGVPLREQNGLLLAAGYAPLYAERPLTDPALSAARQAVERVLTGHEPYPALAVDRHWNLIAANRAVAPLLAGVGSTLLEPPVNVLRLSLHPEGLARRILNYAEWRAHLLTRLAEQVAASRDVVLAALIDELRSYPQPEQEAAQCAPITAGEHVSGSSSVFVPLRLTTDAGTLTMLSTTTVFGTPVDITLSELALECFFPADTETAELLREMAADAVTTVDSKS